MPKVDIATNDGELTLMHTPDLLEHDSPLVFSQDVLIAQVIITHKLIYAELESVFYKLAALMAVNNFSRVIEISLAERAVLVPIIRRALKVTRDIHIVPELDAILREGSKMALKIAQLTNQAILSLDPRQTDGKDPRALVRRRFDLPQGSAVLNTRSSGAGTGSYPQGTFFRAPSSASLGSPLKADQSRFTL